VFRLRKSSHSLQPVPRRTHRVPRPRIDQICLDQREIHSSEVTWGTRHYNVLQIVRTTMTVRDKMVILGPHCLEGRVLLDIFSAPDLQVRIKLTEPLANRLADQRDTAKATMVTVSFVQLALDLKVGHSCGWPQGPRYRVNPFQALAGWHIGTVFSPERFGPFPNRGHVSSSDQEPDAARITTEMSRNSLIQEARCLLNFGNGIPEAISRSARCVHNQRPTPGSDRFSGIS
jgi:hypothetical protein